MSWIEIIMDRKILDAIEEGAFDNLPGKGKPLKLDHDPNVPAELRTAHRLMKEAGVLPDWVQLEKEIRQHVERWEQRTQTLIAQLQQVRERSGWSQRQRDLESDRLRDQFLLQMAEALRERDRMIERFNLIVPSLSRQRLRINLEAEMEALEERFPRTRPYPDGMVPAWRRYVDERKGAVQLGNRMPLRRKRGSIG